MAGYKANTLKLIAFLETTNKLTERKTRETTAFTIASKSMKDLGSNLTQPLKELCRENSCALKKEIVQELRKWQDIPCSRIGRTIIVKMAVPRKLSYSFNVQQFQSKYHLHSSRIWRNHSYNASVPEETWNSKGSSGQQVKAGGMANPEQCCDSV